MIEAELPDGTVLEFPDGTDPAVVDAAVKRHLGAGEEQGVMDRAIGAGELALSGATGVVADALGGLAGISEGLNPLRPEGAAADAVKTIQGMAFEPGERGQAVASDIASSAGEVLDSAKAANANAVYGDGSNPIMALLGLLTEAGGKVASEVAASPDAVAEDFGPLVGAGAASLPTAIGAVSGLRGGSAAAKAVGRSAPRSPSALSRITGKIKAGVADKDTARFHIPKGAAVAVKDAPAVEAIKQGFDEGVIASVKTASPVDRKAMKRMLDVQRRADSNARFATLNRPSDVVGDSLLERVKVVHAANRAAGSRLDGVAKSLKGKEVDFSPAMNQFLDDLGEMGVALDDAARPIFKGSDIEGVTAAENALKRVLKRLASGDDDAFAVHRMKRFIDEHVDFGKNAEGLSGKTESVLKRLRRGLDQSLDSAFPEYNEVNTIFSETKSALDDLQSIAGRRFDFQGPNAEKQIGVLLRRISSNVQSRVPLLNAADALETVARKHSDSVSGDLVSQMMFVNEMERVFGPAAKTGFQGQIIQGATQAGESLARGGSTSAAATDLAIGAVKAGADRLRGVNRENALKAIDALLSR